MDGGVLAEVERALRGQCETLDPDAVTPAEAVSLCRLLGRVEKLAAGARLRLLRRVDEANVAARTGERDTAAWLARETGTSVGAARDALETSKRLGQQSATDEALARGELSAEQATLVSDAAAADPGAEQGLLDAARREPLRQLKERCARAKANADPDAEARRERIRRGRSARCFRDGEGGWNLHVRHLPEVGAEIEALLAPFVHRRFEEARRAGAFEHQDAYRADALLDLARAAHTGAGAPKGARRADTKVIVHIDHDTFVSGCTRPGATCHVDGVGPVDPGWVRQVFGEAFAAAVIQDAVGVRSVVHLGRQVTAHQRTALEARGYCCEVPGCGNTHNLEIAHVDGWALTGRTTLDQLAWLCPHHHDQKTRGRATLAGTPGARTWTGPDGHQHHDPPPQPPPRPDDTTPPPPPPPDPGGQSHLFGDAPAA